ncbi:MAG: tetratricopeptide repeat protein [Desulfamplus sp.]|nr:tetratricopeptide repeat protein [Desulfamplus sp.]
MDKKRKLSSLLQEAGTAYKKGEFKDASALYREALEILPENADVMNLLSCVEHERGNHEEAIPLIKKAIGINPHSPLYRNNLGNFLFGMGKYQDALEAFEKAVELKPAFIDAHYNLGLAAGKLGETKKAMKSFQLCVKKSPDFCDARTNLATIYMDMGKYKKAFQHFKAAIKLKPSDLATNVNFSIALDRAGKRTHAKQLLENALNFLPDHPEILFNLGNFYQKDGKTEKAVSCFERALEKAPGDTRILYNLGTTFMESGERSRAMDYFKKVLGHSPGDPRTNNNMGLIHYHMGEYGKSIPFFEKAIAGRVNFFKAYNNMGLSYKALGKMEEALYNFKEAAKISPGFVEALHNLAETERELGDFESSGKHFRRALELNPDLPPANTRYAYLLKWQCEWDEFSRISKKMDAIIKRQLEQGEIVGETPFMNIIRVPDPVINKRVADSFTRITFDKIKHLGIEFSHEGHTGKPSPITNHYPITIGYLSANFKDHPMAHLLADLFKFHNRNQFRINAYSLGEDDLSSYRKRFRESADLFRDIRHLSHGEAARCIYEDKVDILVDLMGYTQGGRMEIPALGPAPIQVRYMGLAGTSGEGLFDYIIVDEIAVPRDQEKNYAEKFIYMPHTYQINDRSKVISDKPFHRSMFNLPEESFVFCSFNQTYKIDPEIFSTWLEILKRVDNSVLWLMPGKTGAGKNLKNHAQAHGVDPDRLVFTHKYPLDEHLARLKLADLALDTPAVGGAATTSDALYAGIPVITIAGNRFASRMSASILSAIGLGELVTENLESYRDLAVAIACDKERMVSLKGQLRENIWTMPLFDTHGFTLNLERAYIKIFERYLSGKSPALIDLKEDISSLYTAPSLFHHQYESSITRIELQADALDHPRL